MDRGNIVFIVNPRAGNGSAGKRWPLIRDRAVRRLGSFTAALTSGPGDAALLTRQHLQQGAETIICVGGDGTFNEVVNGFMDGGGPVQDKARVAFLTVGRGGDFSRTVDIPTDPDRLFDLLVAGRGLFIDLGRLHFRDFDNRPLTRYFHNIASFGIAGDVVNRANRGNKPLAAPYLRSLLSVLLRRANMRVRLRVDDGPETEMDVWNVAVANGRYHGGGMCIAPEALVDDGLFHVTVIGNLSLAEAVHHLPKLYNGRIGSVKQVQSLIGRQVEASSEQPVLLDIDGELPGCLPVRAQIVPRALFLIAEAQRPAGESACGVKLPRNGA